MKPENIFSKRTKEARLRAGLAQAALSKITGIAKATLSSYETPADGNAKNPPIDKAIAIADALNVSLDWLCGLNSNKGNDKNNEITFDNIMEAIMLLASLNQEEWTISVVYDVSNSFVCVFLPRRTAGEKYSDILTLKQ